MEVATPPPPPTGIKITETAFRALVTMERFNYFKNWYVHMIKANPDANNDLV